MKLTDEFIRLIMLKKENEDLKKENVKLKKAIEILLDNFFIDLIERENDYKLGFSPKQPIENQPRFCVINKILGDLLYELLKEVLEDE